MKEIPQLQFYTTTGCHLCQQAAAMMEQLQSEMMLEFHSIDIAGDESLIRKYGLRIPVVRNPDTDIETGWPFTVEDLIKLL